MHEREACDAAARVQAGALGLKEAELGSTLQERRGCGCLHKHAAGKRSVHGHW